MIVNTNTRGLFLIVLILFFQSCFIHETKSKVEEVAFNGMTRTFESEYASFSPEDILGLYVVNRPEASVSGILKPAGNLFDNLRLRLDGETMKPLNPAFYPAGIHRVDLYAYGPYVSEGLAEGNVLSFSVRREQSTPEALKQSDLLWGRLLEVETSQRRPPQVIFEHQLSKIRISLKAGIGVTLHSPIVLIEGTKPSVQLNLADGELGEATGTITPVTPLRSVGQNVYQAIVIPQTVGMSNRLFTVTNDGKIYHYVLKADRHFQKGTVYTYDITIHADDLEVELSGIINDWIPGDTVTEDLVG